MAFTQEELDDMAKKAGVFEKYREEAKKVRSDSADLFDELAASYISASRHGIDLATSVPVINLEKGMRATVYGVVTSEVSVKTYQRKSGSEGERMHFILEDDTGKIEVLIWDEKVIAGLSEKGMTKGSKIKIANGEVKVTRYGKQINPDKWGTIVVEPEDFPDMLVDASDKDKITPISDIATGGIYNVTGEVITKFDLRSFSRKSGGKGHVLNLILMDDSSSVKVVLWDEIAMECSGIEQRQWVTIRNLSARQNEDIIELHSLNITSISPEKD